MTEKHCLWSTYGNRCQNTFINSDEFCVEHNDLKCRNCGMKATGGCNFCGQFVCGAPCCAKCGGCSVEHGAKKSRQIPELEKIEDFKKFSKNELLNIFEVILKERNDLKIKQWKESLQ